LSRLGFTLVELMVVVVILGMAVSLSSINFRKVMPQSQLNASVRVLSSVLHDTRSDAITRNLEYRIIYDIDEQRYWVETPFRKTGGLALERIPGEEDPEDENARMLTKPIELEPGVLIKQITIDEEDYSDGQCYVRFSPQGSSSAHTIQLFHEGTGREYTIEVLALTGLIRFHEGIFVRDEVNDGDFE
jgi:prepilin-type N-terminal cleavage/methylation domain-containing protein